MKILIDQSGMVAESDILSLSQSLHIKKHKLLDTITNANHGLHPSAELLIKKLEGGITVLKWKLFADNMSMSTENIMDVFLFLNEIGGINVKRNVSGYLAVIYWQIRNLIKGMWPIRLTRRWQSGFWDICRAVFSAMTPLIILATATAVLAYGLYIPIQTILMIYFSTLTVIWASTVAHEYAHVRIITKNYYKSGILQRGLRIGILHRPLTDKQELMSALLGPSIGVISAILLSLLLDLLSNKINIFILVGVTVSVMHIASLLPAYGDGKTIWKRTRKVVL